MEKIKIYRTEEELKKEEEIINTCQSALKKVREQSGLTEEEFYKEITKIKPNFN